MARDRGSWWHELIEPRERFRTTHQAHAPAGISRGNARRRPLGHHCRPDGPVRPGGGHGTPALPGPAALAGPLLAAVVRARRLSRRGGGNRSRGPVGNAHEVTGPATSGAA